MSLKPVKSLVVLAASSAAQRRDRGGLNLFDVERAKLTGSILEGAAREEIQLNSVPNIRVLAAGVSGEDQQED